MNWNEIENELHLHADYVNSLFKNINFKSSGYCLEIHIRNNYVCIRA